MIFLEERRESWRNVIVALIDSPAVKAAIATEVEQAAGADNKLNGCGLQAEEYRPIGWICGLD